MRGNIRFHKHQLNFLLNGEEHWLILDEHYDRWESTDDLVKKLRNGAWYRGTTVEIRLFPDRIWLKATEPGQGTTVPPKFVSNEFRIKVLEDERVRQDVRLQALEDEVKALRAELDELIINNS